MTTKTIRHLAFATLMAAGLVTGRAQAWLHAMDNDPCNNAAVPAALAGMERVDS